ncbi:MAG: HAD family acid phosphatase [Thermoproteus sp.]
MSLGAISFDIDGVLVDASRRLSMCLNGGSVDWDCFLDCSKLGLDSPKYRYIELALRLYERGRKIVVVTGRPEYMRRCTEAQLRSYGVPFAGLYMRPLGDFRQDHLYKADVMARLIRSGVKIWAHFDDNLDTVKALNALGIDAVLAY